MCRNVGMIAPSHDLGNLTLASYHSLGAGVEPGECWHRQRGRGQEKRPGTKRERDVTLKAVVKSRSLGVPVELDYLTR